MLAALAEALPNGQINGAKQVCTTLNLTGLPNLQVLVWFEFLGLLQHRYVCTQPAEVGAENTCPGCVHLRDACAQHHSQRCFFVVD